MHFGRPHGQLDMPGTHSETLPWASRGMEPGSKVRFVLTGSFDGRSKTGPRNLGFGFAAKHRFHFIVGRPRTHVISSLDFGSRVYLRSQWELARSLAERRLLTERE